MYMYDKKIIDYIIKTKLERGSDGDGVPCLSVKQCASRRVGSNPTSLTRERYIDIAPNYSRRAARRGS